MLMLFVYEHILLKWILLVLTMLTKSNKEKIKNELINADRDNSLMYIECSQ